MMSKLNILFISKWYPSEIDSKSGIFVEEFAKAISLRHNVTVLFAYPSPKRIKGFYEIQKEQKGNLQVIKARYKNFLPLPGILEAALFNWWIKHLFKKIVAPIFKPDIIHAHVYKAGPSALAIGKLVNAPVLLSEHSTEFIVQKELTFEFRLLARLTLSRFFRILPVSNYLKEHLLTFAPKDKFFVVPNVVDTELFYPPAPNAAQNHRKKKILTVSILRPEKGISDLIKALGLIKEKRQDFVLDIVGDGGERKKLEQLTINYGLNDFINFHGMQPKEEVARFMRNCDFFVLPTYIESFGCVFIEAMACGKPIVATRTCCLPDLIKEDMGILVPPGNLFELQRAIENMLDNYSRFSSRNIVKYIRNNFSYTAVAAKLDHIYQETLKEWRQKHE